MAPAYRVEELLALRDSVSESAVSLDRFADEDVIKEHVLRPSVSAQLIGRRSDRSLRPFVPRLAAPEAQREVTPETASAIVSTATYKRPSPSPSIKRGKAERLLKEHGSPPGLRVTAGGRIVPGDLPPLGTRPSFNIYNPQALRAAPGNIMAAQLQPSSNNSARIEIVDGQPIVFVGDRMFALPAVNNSSALPATASVTNDTLSKQTTDTASLSTQGVLPGLSFGPPRASSQTPFAGLDLPTLRAQQAAKKQELRTVEQTEVLQSSHQTEVWRASMIERKRNLIVELDTLRKQISTFEANPAIANQHNASTDPVGAMAASVPSLSSFVPPYQQPLAPSMYGFPATNPYAPMMMYPPPFGTFPSFPAVDPAPFVPPPVNPLPHSPGSINRRSRAIEIKPPHEESKKQTSSALDPKSPTYEPKSSSAQDTIPPTPSPNKRSPWRQHEVSESEKQPDRTLSHKPSLSSVDTTDFFPTNTHEHSSTRVAPTAGAARPARDESMVIPATPEKSWPASPWNENNTGRSRNDEPAPKIGSWPDAFGKPPSLSTLKQESSSQSSLPVQSLTLQTGSYLHSSSSNPMLNRFHSQQRAATEEVWPFSMPKAVAHIPSTYQEGFQAGYDHIGMPDSIEVLQGYIQGLLTFLADSLNNGRSSASARDSHRQAADSRTPSLQGLVAESMPHDSAVSMTFNRGEAPVGGQENVRASQGHGALNSRRDSAYSPQGTTRNAPASFPPSNDFTQDPRQLSDLKYPNPTGLFPERQSSGYRHMASPYPSPNDETSNALEKGVVPRSDVQTLNHGLGRPFSGSQLTNRTNANFQAMPRFYAVHKEVGPSGNDGNNMPAARPFANLRMSGLDGAMDDLADLVMETKVDDDRSPVSRPTQFTAAPGSTDADETGASCFKPSGGKGKQKMTSSPTRPTESSQEMAASSPAKVPSSPKKSGEHSPAKAKLEKVTNRFRRSKKDDPRTMSSEEKVKRSEKWRQRFDYIKQTERAEIEGYREEESRRNGGRR